MRYLLLIRLLQHDILPAFVQLALLQPGQHAAHRALRRGRDETGAWSNIAIIIGIDGI